MSQARTARSCAILAAAIASLSLAWHRSFSAPADPGPAQDPASYGALIESLARLQVGIARLQEDLALGPEEPGSTPPRPDEPPGLSGLEARIVQLAEGIRLRCMLYHDARLRDELFAARFFRQMIVDPNSSIKARSDAFVRLRSLDGSPAHLHGLRAIWLESLLDSRGEARGGLLFAGFRMRPDDTTVDLAEDIARSSPDAWVREKALQYLEHCADYPRVWQVIKAARDDPSEKVRGEVESMILEREHRGWPRRQLGVVP